MEKKELFCEICKVQSSDVKSHEAHIIGKKHQLALHNVHVTEKKRRYSVFIGGLPNMVPKEDIITFLSGLGDTTDIYIPEPHTFAFVEFEDENTAQELIKKQCIYFRGKPLTVKPRIYKAETNEQDQLPSDADFERITASLKNIPDFDEQMKVLLSHLQPNQPKQMWDYRLLCEDLQRCITNIFPGCRIYPFGSTITRLNFANSDVDVYVDLTANFRKEHSAHYVKKARHALPKYCLFTNVLAIPKAKTPIVKCVHIQTNIRCDFNFKNMLGVCNSYLIRHYISLAPNLLWTLMVLKYWARVHEFTGASNRLSNYSLIMMFIFFIQQEPYNVESVENMQKLKGTENMQDGWNGGFQPNEMYNSTLSRKSILEMLQCFFEFYSNFDYNLNVISPFLGKSVPKIDFFKPEILNDAFLLYKVNLVSMLPLIVQAPLCVQDPFEHNHNLTQRICNKFLEDFVIQCKHSANLLRDDKSHSGILYRLFVEEPTDGKFKYNNRCEFKIDMRSRLQYIESKIPDNATDKASRIKSIWYHMMNEFIVMFLIKILHADVNVMKEAPNIEPPTRDAVYIDNVTFCCKGNYNTWECRKTVTKDINLNKVQNGVDKEVSITNYIVDVLCKDIVREKPIVHFYITLFARESPIQMDFVVTNISSAKGTFKSLCTFLTNKLPYLFNHYEEELNSNAAKPETNN